MKTVKMIYTIESIDILSEDNNVKTQGHNKTEVMTKKAFENIYAYLCEN
jgi:hypothetical protein